MLDPPASGGKGGDAWPLHLGRRRRLTPNLPTLSREGIDTRPLHLGQKGSMPDKPTSGRKGVGAQPLCLERRRRLVPNLPTSSEKRFDPRPLHLKLASTRLGFSDLRVSGKPRFKWVGLSWPNLSCASEGSLQVGWIFPTHAPWAHFVLCLPSWWVSSYGLSFADSRALDTFCLVSPIVVSLFLCGLGFANTRFEHIFPYTSRHDEFLPTS